MDRKTLIAGAVFAVLALAAFGLLRAPEKGARTGEAPRPVPRLAAADFDTLVVTKDAASTTIKKDGALYKVIAPVLYPAEADAAKQAFEALEKLEFDGVVSDQKSKHDEFEVGAKGVRVQAKKGDKVVADLRVGKSLGSNTLVRAEGKDDVWQAVGSLKYQFDKDAAGWRDKSITTFDEKEAQKIEVVGRGGDRIVVEKPASPDGGAGETEWRVIESSLKVDALDKSIPTGIVSALYSWKTNDFADGAKPEETGIAAPALKIVVTLKGGKTQTVLVGNKKGEEDTYVKADDRPQVFLVKKYNLERVAKRPVEFRDKTLCNLAESDLTEISVARDKDGFALAKPAGKTGGEAWKFAKPSGANLDSSKMSGITAAFQDWKAAAFAEDASPKTTGLAKPQATITAKAAGKKSSCVLKVGVETSDKQNYLVQPATSDDVFVVAKWAADRVLVKLEDLKKK